MIWIEMSRDPVHGGGSWGFTKCLWSPAYKSDGSEWAFWETLLQTQEEDTVLHLRGKGKNASFVGFSSVESDGFVTNNRPPEPAKWGYAKSFYRVLLRDYIPFSEPIALSDVFSTSEKQLREFFKRNKARQAGKKKRLFYVIQSGRLQCLNGAYLSEVDDELLDIILGGQYQYTSVDRTTPRNVKEVDTGEQIRQLMARIGQSQFSDQVRANYNNRCCYPGCTISDKRFLVAGHIARWADSPELRGQISNGICLCLMHDRAFEGGLFTIDLDHNVWVNKQKVVGSEWLEKNLLPFHGARIQLGPVVPSEVALRAHWTRTQSMPRLFQKVEDA